MLSRWTASLLLVQTQLPFPDIDLRRDVTETDELAYFLGPAKPIASGNFVKVEWSPDDATFCAQSRVKDEIDVSFWNRKTEKLAKVLTSAKPLEVQFQQSAKCAWLFNNRDGERPSTVYRYSVDSGRLTPIFDPRDRYATVTAAPSGDAALITMSNVHQREYTAVVYMNGRVTEIALPDGAAQAYGDVYDGKLVLEVIGGARDGRYFIDPSTGQVGAAAGAPKWEPPVGTFFGKIVKFARADDARISTHWLSVHTIVKSAPPAPNAHSYPITEEVRNGKLMPQPAYMNALIGADVKGTAFGRNRTALAYWDRSNLFVREVKTMPEKDFMKLYSEWEEKVLSENAKQAGTAIQMYSSDADDYYPQGTGSLDMLFPYAKDPGVFDSFHYDMNGQNSKDIKDPANTALGRINGRSGRAIVYADGHVVWERRNRV